MDGFLFFGVGLLVVAVGVFHRRSLFRAYASDRKQYTGTTPMKIIHLEESTMTTWEEQEDGTRLEGCTTVHLPTYEYTVDGKTYTYSSRQDWGSPKGVGRQKTGYYDPKNPDLIREDKPRKPLLGGGIFFLFAAICLLAEILVIRDMIIWGL